MAPPDTNPDVSAIAAAPALTEWHLDLQAEGARRDEAVAHLHGLLLRAARFEVFRRRNSLPQISAAELDDLAQQAADDAAVSVLRRLDDFRGESNFRTWAYKFALLEAVREGIRSALTPRQRQVLVATVLEGVPIDVLAERLGSNRNALYKVLHDARRRLREHVAAAGFPEATR